MQNAVQFETNRRNLVLGASAAVAAVATGSATAAAQETRGSTQNTRGELARKRALVTGASRGIGAAIALALADKGADVAITYLNEL